MTRVLGAVEVGPGVSIQLVSPASGELAHVEVSLAPGAEFPFN